MQRVLMVTDDWGRKAPLKAGLLERGFAVTPVASDAVFRDELPLPKQLDAVIVDLERCAMDSGKLCHAIRKERVLKEVPLVLLVTEAHLERLEFSWGLDDYLTLPVSAERIAQRLRFLMWKRHRVQPGDGFSLGGLAIDFERYEVHVHGEPVDLTYKEFELLKFLATNRGKPFTREALLNKVWGYDYYGGTRTVDVHIRRLRSKIETGPTLYIETVRNVGYKFIDPAE